MKANLSGILAILIWSSLTTLVSMTGDLPGLQLAAMTFFLGSIVILAGQKIAGIPILSAWKNSISTYLFVTAGIGVYTALLFLSFKWIPPFEANVLNYTWPILLALFLFVSQNQKISFSQMLGIFLGFMGVAVIFGRGLNFENISGGHVMAFFAAVLWALYSSYAKKFSYSVFFLAPVFLLSGIICLILHMIFEETIIPSGPQIIFVVILGAARIAYLMWDYGIRNGNALLLSSLSYLIPFLSTGLLVFAGFRPTDPNIIYGSGLILFGCLMTNWLGIKKLFTPSS